MNGLFGYTMGEVEPKNETSDGERTYSSARLLYRLRVRGSVTVPLGPFRCSIRPFKRIA